MKTSKVVYNYSELPFKPNYPNEGHYDKTAALAHALLLWENVALENEIKMGKII